MHKKHAAFVAAAAVLAIIFAAGTAAITKIDGAAPVTAAVPEATADPVGADDWMYLQRANADGSIPAAAVNEAIAQSKAAGAASKGSPSTDQVWAELGPSNIGGRVRDTAADPTTKDVVYVATGSGGLWKSTDGGATLAMAWDTQLPQSMGAVAVRAGHVRHACLRNWRPGIPSHAAAGNDTAVSADRAGAADRATAAAHGGGRATCLRPG